MVERTCVRGGAAPRSPASTSALAVRRYSSRAGSAVVFSTTNGTRVVEAAGLRHAVFVVIVAPLLWRMRWLEDDYGSLMVVGCEVGGAARLRGRGAAAGAILHRLGERESSSTEGLGASLRRTGGVLWSACGTTGRPGRLERLGTNVTWTSVWRGRGARRAAARGGGLCERNYGGLEIFGPGANTESQNSS